MAVCETEILIALAQEGSERALSQVVEENMGLVHMAARRFMGRGTEYDDLVQIGSIGLIKAVKRFDCTKNLALSTYAVPVILGELKRYFRDTGSIKISRSVKETAAKCMRASEELAKKLGREATVSEIAAECKISSETVSEALETLQPMLSFDEKLDTDGTASFESLIGTDPVEQMTESIALKEALSDLSAKERTLVANRFMLAKTQTETAKCMGISQVQVSRMEKNIIAKLRAYFCVNS